MIAKTNNSSSRRWGFLLIGLALILIGCVVRVLDPYPVRMTRLVYFDILQRLSPRDYNAELPVRVVDIDEESLATWGQWPWPRTLLAQMVDRLGDYGAAVIAFDVLFVEPDRYSPSRLANDPALSGLLQIDPSAAQRDNDVQFGEVIAGWPVVLGAASRLSPAERPVKPKAGIIEIGEAPSAGLVHVPHWTPSAPPLDTAATGIGGVNISPLGGTGIVRRVPVLWHGPDGVLPGLSLEALRVAMGEPVIFAEGAADESGIMLAVELGGYRLPTTESGEVWVRYRRDDPGLYLSARDVLQPQDNPALRSQIEGHIVLVGTSAAGLFDLHQTALGETVPGVSIHAQIIEQILTEDMLSRSDVTAALELLAFVILGVLVTIVMSRFGAVVSFVAGGVAASVVLGISWLAFQNQSVLFDVTFPLMGGMANFGVLACYLFFSTERDKRIIRRTFSHYVAPEVLDEMEATGNQLKLGGETQDITVMFSDVRGFTPLSESVSATQLVTLLNALFSQVGDKILEQQGTIDKFIGDAIMAFWNAPLPIRDHPRRAAQAALQMRSALARFNAMDDMKGRQPISLATGCATGRACVGNIGSRTRFNYTVIGDVVNVAARIEQSCRQVDYDIVVSSSVHLAIRDKMAVLEAGFVELKGKSELEPVFVVVGDADLRSTADFRALRSLHLTLIAAIRERQSHADIVELCLQCEGIGSQVEPGLAEFYRAIPGRVSDFRSDVQSDALVFSHHARR